MLDDKVKMGRPTDDPKTITVRTRISESDSQLPTTKVEGLSL